MKYIPIYVNSAYVDLFYFHYFVTYRCNKGNIKTCLGFNKNMISGFGVYLCSCDVQDTQQKIVVDILWIMIMFFIYLHHILWFSFKKIVRNTYIQCNCFKIHSIIIYMRLRILINGYFPMEITLNFRIILCLKCREKQKHICSLKKLEGGNKSNYVRMSSNNWKYFKTRFLINAPKEKLIFQKCVHFQLVKSTVMHNDHSMIIFKIVEGKHW